MEHLTIEILEQIREELTLMLHRAKSYSSYPTYLTHVRNNFHSAYRFVVQQPIYLTDEQAFEANDSRISNMLDIVCNVLHDKYEEQLIIDVPLYDLADRSALVN